MLTLPIIWLVLAAAVIVIATVRKRAASPTDGDSPWS